MLRTCHSPRQAIPLDVHVFKFTPLEVAAKCGELTVGTTEPTIEKISAITLRVLNMKASVDTHSYKNPFARKADRAYGICRR
jgi:hypothetical protein